MNDLAAHPQPSPRLLLPVLAMLIGMLGATALATWLAWQHLQRQAGHRFKAETLAVAHQVETACNDTLNSLRGIRDALPRPVSLTNLPEPAQLLSGLAAAHSHAVAVVALGLKTDRDGLTNVFAALSARTGSNPMFSFSTLPVPRQAGRLGTELGNAFFPVVQVATQPGFFERLCECDCWSVGSDLLRIYSQGSVNSQVFEQVIGSGQVAFNAVVGLVPGDCLAPEQAAAPTEFLAMVLLAVYSPAGAAAPANSWHRLPHTEALLLAGISLRRVVQPVLEPHQGDFGIRFRYGRREYAQLNEWAEPITFGEADRAESRYSLEHEVNVGGLAGRLSFKSSRMWEWSTGFWLAWLVAGVGLTACGGLTVKLTQLHAARLQESEAVELRAANAALAAVRETREQITRELHDNTLQNLYALGLELKQGRERLQASAPEAGESLDRSLDEVRRISNNLRHFLTSDGPGRHTLGAAEVWDSIAERFRRSSGAAIELNLDRETALSLPARTTAELAQIMREAIANALRHGAAQQVTVRLVPYHPAGWRLEIQDDGRGFDPAGSTKGSGLGLRHMEHRATSLGAGFALESSPESGTRLTITWPAGSHFAPPATSA